MQKPSGPSFLYFGIGALAFALANAGCSSQSPGGDTGESDGSLTGELSVYVATLADGTARSEYYLRLGGEDGEERKLVFASDPDLPSGRRIKVWGDQGADDIRVSRYVLEAKQRGGVGSISQGLIGAPKYDDRRIVWVYVDIGGGPSDLPTTEAQRKLFGMAPTDKSLKQYYLEDSYGTQDISGDVVGPLSFPLAACSNTDTRNLATTLRSQVPGTYNHYLWYFNTHLDACSWSGLASVGSPDAPSRDTWYNSSESCTVLVQEPGHNFGMAHSAALHCPGAAFADNPASCTHEEYGDHHDPMGGGCYHMNAWQKAYQGWFGGCNSVTVRTKGTYTLLPIEQQCNGVQVLQIPMPKERPYTYPAGGGGNGGSVVLRYYYLELRTNNGMFDPSLPNTPYVLVHVADEYRSRTQRGQHTWVLDMNPATTGRRTVDGMRAGETFTDPAGGTSFTVEAISQTSASIVVDLPSTGGSTCMDGTPIEAPGPATCGTGGTGSGGTVGTGGMAGSAGEAGTAGSGGTGGDTGGSAGNAGFGGTGADGGVGGVGGAGADGGTGAIAGVGGTGGDESTIEDPGIGPELELNDDSGCACRTAPAPRPGALGLLFGLGLLVFKRRRR